MRVFRPVVLAQALLVASRKPDLRLGGAIGSQLAVWRVTLLLQESAQERIKEAVYYRRTRTNFGARRNWFECPKCHRACSVLYGGKYFTQRVGVLYCILEAEMIDSEERMGALGLATTEIHRNLQTARNHFRMDKKKGAAS
jgi:hypothetical protein